MGGEEFELDWRFEQQPWWDVQKFRFQKTFNIICLSRLDNHRRWRAYVL